jgi:3D (Asp-Asp-Asp) domain-containing protein
MVEGIGEVTVRDKGGAIQGMRLDLFWDETDRAGALRFGRQVRKVTVLN